MLEFISDILAEDRVEHIYIYIYPGNVLFTIIILYSQFNSQIEFELYPAVLGIFLIDKATRLPIILLLGI